MLFEPKEPGSWSGRSGEDLIPVWNRMQMVVAKTGFRGYVISLFQQADIIATLGAATDWRESDLVDVHSQDFYDPNYTIVMTQLSLKALAGDQPPYYSVQISFRYEADGHHVMTIKGHEQTYQGILLKSFHDWSADVQSVQDGLVQAMLQPEVNTPNAK
ncbi:MAG: hypothetical protein AAB889_03380 [Patescibacteria group bacterium]